MRGFATQLNTKSLQSFKVQVPTYNRYTVTPSIVHLGVGAFSRSHLSVYTDDILSEGNDTRWGILGAGIIPQDKKMNEVMQK